jgi:glycosyltransferase involved in cell wall biosynthesis
VFLESHGLYGCVEQKRGLSRQELATIYCRAAVVLVPSLAEGFGLPVIEALACGTPVVASDIPVLREVGFDGVRFCSPADRAEWVKVVEGLLISGKRVDEETRARVQERYSWHAHAETIWASYAAGGSKA